MKSDEIERVILSFVTEKRGKATKNDVVVYMNKKGLLSRVPTLNNIDELESSGKITVARGKNNRRGQAHFLAINNQSAYNRIYNWLTEIEIILNEVEEPLEYIYYHIVGEPLPNPSISKEWYHKRSEVLSNFLYACHAPIERLLHFLYILSNRVIRSEKDSQLLNEKIVDLYLKLMNVFSMKNTLDDLDSYLKDDIAALGSHFKNTQLSDYIKGTEINLDFGYKLLEKIQKFRKEVIEDFSRI